MKVLVQGGKAQDVRFAYRVGSSTVARDVESVTSVNGLTQIGDTATPAQPGDFILFVDGPLRGKEIPVQSVSTNSFILASDLEPDVSDEFFVMRYRTQQVDESGSQIVTLSLSPISTINFASYSGAITTGAWVELLTATADEVNEIGIYNGSGKTLRLGTGAAASEVQVAIVPAGVYSTIKIIIPAGTRVSLRAIEGNSPAGVTSANFFGEV